MATMNRNVNLEEINTDAFMGIPYLNYQSPLQKVIFWGSLVVAIGINLIINFFFQINMVLTILFTLLPLMVGIAYGCNYNEDLSLIQYFKLIMFKPTKTYFSCPTEDLQYLRNSAERIRQEEELKKRQQQQATPEEQRKLLFKLLIGIVIAVVFLVVILVAIYSTKTEEVHHTISMINSICEWEC